MCTMQPTRFAPLRVRLLVRSGLGALLQYSSVPAGLKVRAQGREAALVWLQCRAHRPAQLWVLSGSRPGLQCVGQRLCTHAPIMCRVQLRTGVRAHKQGQGPLVAVPFLRCLRGTHDSLVGQR